MKIESCNALKVTSGYITKTTICDGVVENSVFKYAMDVATKYAENITMALDINRSEGYDIVNNQIGFDFKAHFLKKKAGENVIKKGQASLKLHNQPVILSREGKEHGMTTGGVVPHQL